MKLILALCVPLLFSSCAPKPEPVLEEATVVARNASVRQKNSPTSRTLVTLNVGDKVDVLQREENWYRIRHGEQLQGWMEESTLVTTENAARIKQLAESSKSEPAQNTAVVHEEVNYRIEPGRSSAVIRKLDVGTKVEVLQRATVPRPGSDSAFDVWLKVRTKNGEAGWVSKGLVDFDTPSELEAYTEEMTYPAVKVVNKVEDSIAGTTNWYVVAERATGLNSMLDFDGIRVFTWNQKMHRYETAFRERGLRGVYPLEVGRDTKDNPTFRYYELDADDKTKTPHDYVMYGVVPRPLNSPPKPRKKK